jgi:hypothetical protein
MHIRPLSDAKGFSVAAFLLGAMSLGFDAQAQDARSPLRPSQEYLAEVCAGGRCDVVIFAGQSNMVGRGPEHTDKKESERFLSYFSKVSIKNSYIWINSDELIEQRNVGLSKRAFRKPIRKTAGFELLQPGYNTVQAPTFYEEVRAKQFAIGPEVEFAIQYEKKFPDRKLIISL